MNLFQETDFSKTLLLFALVIDMQKHTKDDELETYFPHKRERLYKNT